MTLLTRNRHLAVPLDQRYTQPAKKAGSACYITHDNGLRARCSYIAKDTLDTATALGLTLCFTPIRSPESNGIAEAFVKTFKRDYARLSILPDAETIIALLPAWCEDYNEVHPHSGLKFLSPREFLGPQIDVTAPCFTVIPLNSSRLAGGNQSVRLCD